MVSVKQVYLFGFLALSAVIGLAVWPRSQRNWGLLTGTFALTLSLVLSWLVISVGGSWFALGQRLELAASGQDPSGWNSLLRTAAKLLGSLADALADLAQSAFPTLPLNLGIVLIFLTFYLLFKTALLALIRTAGLLVRNTHSEFKIANLPKPDAANLAALRSSTTGMAATLAFLLALLPYLMPLHPALELHFNTLFWAGAWIMLLELLQWLYSGAGIPPRLKTVGSEVRSRPIQGSLDRLYNECRKRHGKLLLYCAKPSPQPFGALECSAQFLQENPATHPLRTRLAGYLPDALADPMLASVNHYEGGADLLFIETLSGYHFLLLTELIQRHTNRAEVTLLICPHLVLPQVEQALQQQLELHQLYLPRRWAVLGRDDISIHSPPDVMICPDSELERALLPPNTLQTLKRLCSLVCLDLQSMPLSLLQLSLSRLWLVVPRDRVRIIAQTDAYHNAASQARDLLGLREPGQYRLSPTGGQRYLLLWDAHSPYYNYLMQKYFPDLEESLDSHQLLFLLPWELGFDVTHLESEGYYNEAAYDYLHDELLSKYGHEELVHHARPYQSVGRLYAANQNPVCQLEDRNNLALALDTQANLLSIVCGNYLLRDYYLACLRELKNPYDLPTYLRPLATRPRSAESGEVGSSYYNVIDERGVHIGYLALGDHGLSYVRGQSLLIQGRFYRIAEIDQRVVARHQKDAWRNPRRRYVFHREYRLLPGLSCDGERTYVTTLSDGLRLEIKQLYARFQRNSKGYWELAEDLRPLATLPSRWRYVSLTPAIERCHLLGNIARIRLRQTNLCEEHVLERVAFTFCALLQEAMVSLFPRHSHRLAVVSPQASRGAGKDDVTGFYHRIYPAMASAEVTGADTLDVYIMEDADHDLGVIRSLCEQGIQILLKLLRDYLAWALAQPEASLYQAFGGASLPDCLDYRGALKLLDKLKPDWTTAP